VDCPLGLLVRGFVVWCCGLEIFTMYCFGCFVFTLHLLVFCWEDVIMRKRRPVGAIGNILLCFFFYILFFFTVRLKFCYLGPVFWPCPKIGEHEKGQYLWWHWVLV